MAFGRRRFGARRGVLGALVGGVRPGGRFGRGPVFNRPPAVGFEERVGRRRWMDELSIRRDERATVVVDDLDDHDDHDDGDLDGPAGAGATVGSGPSLRPPAGGSVLPPRPLREERDGPGERGERRALFPAWLGDPWPTVRWWLGDRVHAVVFHLVRLPLYTARAAGWTPRGLGRGGIGLWRWVTDAQSASLRWHAAELGDVDGYMHLTHQSSLRTRARAGLVGVSALGVVGAVVVAWPTPLGRLAVYAAVIAVGGWLGRPADRPLFEHPVLAPSRVRITPDLLVEAFCAAKLCNKHEDPDRHQTARFLAPVARDGAGWRAVVDLPGGHTASKALARKEQLAAGLGIDEVRVFLERVRGDDGSARRVQVWVADRDPYAAPARVSPLVKVQETNLWDPMPFGDDARGQLVTLLMVFTCILIGAIPRMGKTYVLRLIAAFAALDPRVRNIVFCGKGGSDLRAFAKVAYRCGFGPRDAVVAHLDDVLAECITDMEARYETMGTLPPDVCPESKVTPAMCANRRLNMALTMITIDEVQVYLGHKTWGPSIEESLIRLAKEGPAAGIILNLATQRPGEGVMSTDLRDVIGTRYSLKAMTYQSSEMILGAGTYKAGIDASKLQRSHKGVGILLGADDSELAEEGPQIVRAHLLTREQVEAICDRGRAARLAAGTLEGAAAGEQLLTDTPRRNILDDVAGVFGQGDTKLWSESICARLATDHPDIYGGWGPTELATALGPYGIETDQQWGYDQAGRGRNRRGVLRQHVLDAQAQRATPGERIASTGPLAARARLAAGPARSSTPASAPDQATSDLADPPTDLDTPGNGDSPARPLAPGQGTPDDDHQP